MIEYDAAKVARLLDTNGLISLHKGTSTQVLCVTISYLSKDRADAIAKYCKCGYVRQQRKDFYYFIVYAELAIDVLDRLDNYSKWQRRQIKIARSYQRLKRDVVNDGNRLSGNDVEYGNRLSEQISRYNEQLKEKQKNCRINRLRKVGKRMEKIE